MGARQADRTIGEPDVAQMVNPGPYRLVAWSARTGVQARCYGFNKQGKEILLFDHTIDTAAANHEFDSVRCVMVNEVYFVIFYLDYDSTAGTYALEAKWLDMSNVDTVQSWTALSTITPDDAGLYDVKQVYNATGNSEYVLAWASSPNEFIVRLVTDYDHTTGVAWSTTVGSVAHADRVLACHADGGSGVNEGGVVIVYQNNTNALIAYTLDYNDGTANAAGTVFSAYTADFSAVGICRTADKQVAVIGEFQNLDLPGAFTEEEERSHHIVCQEMDIDATPSTIDKYHVTPNLNMMSKPYAYTDAEGSVHVYCGLGYKTVNPTYDWGQNVGFVCDMGYQHWGDGQNNSVRPRPVMTLNQGTVDSDVHDDCPEASGVVGSGLGKRTNHLSNWVLGPDLSCDVRKSRTVAWPGWAAIGTRSDSAAQSAAVPEPVGATIRCITHVLEDAWMYDRDSLDGTALTVNFHGPNPRTLHDNAPVNKELIVAGGTPHIYDGAQYVELGFPWVPEIVDISDNGAGTIDAGDYRYLAVYEWHDTNGVLHRSGHGFPLMFSNTLGQAVDITVRCMNISNRDADWLYPNARDIVIALYRTTIAQPNKFRRLFASETTLAEPNDNMVNDPTVWAMTITDDLDDSILKSAPLLSFAFGDPAANELAPVQPPAAHCVASWKNRVWLATSEREHELWFSKEVVGSADLGEVAPEFNPTFHFRVDSVKGTPCKLIPQDDALILLTTGGIYAITGEGPDSLGSGADYRLQVLHELTGCIEPRSVAAVPMGTLFQSYKGMYMLNKGFELDHVSAGAPVYEEIRTAGNVRSGENLDDRHVVAWVANDAVSGSPIVIKWDYLQRQFSTADLQPPHATAVLATGCSGCAWQGATRDLTHVVLCQGALLVERGRDDSTPYRDESNGGVARSVIVDIETGWIALASLMGYKRVWEIGLHTGGGSDELECELDIDTDGSFTVGSHEDHQSLKSTTVPGHLRIRPGIQKMAAFRLRITEPADNTEGDLTIYGITAKIGMKRGLRKVADSKVATSDGT